LTREYFGTLSHDEQVDDDNNENKNNKVLLTFQLHERKESSVQQTDCYLPNKACVARVS
jgi:hypothetical protein